MKKVSFHIVVIITAIFIIFTLGLFIGRLQLPKETIPSGTQLEQPKPNLENTTKLNINTATIDELCTLPGIGSATAKAIVDYRTTNGTFDSIEQLMDIKGIGFKKLDDLIDLICLE